MRVLIQGVWVDVSMRWAGVCVNRPDFDEPVDQVEDEIALEDGERASAELDPLLALIRKEEPYESDYDRLPRFGDILAPRPGEYETEGFPSLAVSSEEEFAVLRGGKIRISPHVTVPFNAYLDTILRLEK